MQENKVGSGQLMGIALISTSVLTLEVVLTRVFSVTLWYHFAFLAISLVLMGSATAGVLLYFTPDLAQPQRARRWVRGAALALALSIPATFALYLQMPMHKILATDQGITVQQIGWLLALYADLSLPFLLAGAVLSLSLAAWPQQAGRIYWADLSGAALGCLLSIPLLEHLGGTQAVLAVGVLPALAGLLFTITRSSSVRRWARKMTPVVLTLLLVTGFTLGNMRWNWIEVTSSRKGGEEPTRTYEKWNAHSRVTVYKPVNCPFFWSVDDEYWAKTIAEGGLFHHALLLIDAVAGTPIQHFDGDLQKVSFLRYDVTSFVYHLLERPNTLVIGPGGGRDVLAALASGAPHVTAVEVNRAVIDAVRGPYGEFSGRLYDRPDVTLAIADARGFVARSPERYDVIQASLIDTWAAGGSGAFALSENSLYTAEAFQTYREHLTERGIVAVSRWYQPERPAETLRLVSTAMAGWQRSGVIDASQCVAVVARTASSAAGEGLATVLLKRTPFSAEEVRRLERQAEELNFLLLYAPGRKASNEAHAFITAADRAAFIDRYPLDISPATDNRPFFFNIVRLGDVLDSALRNSTTYRVSMEAVVILAAVLLITTGCAVCFVAVPLLVGRLRKRTKTPPPRILAYFALLGLAFMLVEVPTIQKLTVYLGHPTYSLVVVLFTLLLFGGLGSYWSNRWDAEKTAAQRMPLVFLALTVLIALHTLASLWPLPQTMVLRFRVRLLVSMGLLAPLGFLMGIPFPTGIRKIGATWSGIIPWIWGINGITSVLGSALATALAIQAGFRVTLLVGLLCYAEAGFLMWVKRRAPQRNARRVTAGIGAWKTSGR